jgi:hypothetical protein
VFIFEKNVGSAVNRLRCICRNVSRKNVEKMAKSLAAKRSPYVSVIRSAFNYGCAETDFKTDSKNTQVAKSHTSNTRMAGEVQIPFGSVSVVKGILQS